MTLFTDSTSRSWRELVAAAMALGLAGAIAGCGGGGSGDSPPAPPAAGTITIADGGTVTSDDGRLQLIVAAHSASAEGVATLTKVAPPPDIAADPRYVADSAYAYDGPSLDFAPPANWELVSPRATPAAADERKFALAASSNDVDVDSLCAPAYAQTLGVAAQTVSVQGNACPAGCEKVRASEPAGRTLCEPPPELETVPLGAACPAGTTDLSSQPAWADWSATNQLRLCEPAPASAAPMLMSGTGAVQASCGARAGKFVCKPSQVTSGTIGGFLIDDQEPPSEVKLGFLADATGATPSRTVDGSWDVLVPDGQSVPLRFEPSAIDGTSPSGGGALGGVEIREMKYVPARDGGLRLVNVLVWEAGYPFDDGYTPNTFIANPLWATVPYASSDAPERWFRARAYDTVGNARWSAPLRIARLSPSAPVVASFAANPGTLPPGGGAAVLSWSVNGASTINIVPSLGNVGSPSGSASVVVTGTTVYTLTATNPYGQTAVSNAIVTVEADTTAPSVSLGASATAVTQPGSVTFTATASDAGGIEKVEFYRGTTLVSTDTGAPYQLTVNFGPADVGSVAFSARAYDNFGNAATSAALSVVVSHPPASGDTWASPAGIDTGNTTCAQANPCRSIAQAAATAQANKTVWLLNGVYDGSTQPVPIQIPAGLTLRAATPGMAGIGQQIVLQGNATVMGIVLRRNSFGDFGSIEASAGTVTLDGVKPSGSAGGPSGFPAVLALTGTVQVTMTPGGVADYADQLTPVGQSTGIYATLADTARLTVNGGTFGGAALGGADGVNGAFNRGAFNLTGSSRLELNNVVLNVESSGIFLFGDTTQVKLNASVLNAAANIGPGYGIHAAKGTPQITLVDSTISGFDNAYSRASTGISVGTFGQPGVQATVGLTNSSVTGNNAGLFVNDGGSSPSSLVLAGSSAVVKGNTHGGIVCRDACNVDLAGGSVSENATSNPAANGHTFHGGVWMGLATKTYQLKLRNVLVVDNRSTAGSNADSNANSGVTMAGDGSSSFDLGTAASPGNNGFRGNTSSAQTSGLNVAVAAGVIVRAAGNTFAPNVQGADAQGRYLVGSAPCGATSCDLASGAGESYRVTSGTLRLAE